jgi:hypothetical protein
MRPGGARVDSWLEAPPVKYGYGHAVPVAHVLMVLGVV